MKHIAAITMLVVFFAGTAHAWGCGGPEIFIERALSNDPAKADVALKRLRFFGPMALEAVVAERDAVVQSLAANGDNPDVLAQLNERKAKLDRLIDQVGGARYCSVSQLYWYTDLAQALKVAEAEKKPVLTLRMLGQLTDEFSCANSRFFRTTLYANKDVSDYLRQHYVLHWESVRPVPKITIDFGDGRRVERTITGNSAHYVLAADGQCVEVLPGLYGPQQFLAWLERASGVAKAYSDADADNRAWFLRQYHAAQRDAIVRQWQNDLARVAPEVARTVLTSSRVPVYAKAPPAAAAAKLAAGKGDVEVPLLRAMAADPKLLEESTDSVVWDKIAALHAGEVRFDGATLAIMRQEAAPTAEAAMRVAITKRRAEDPLLKMVRNLTTSVALDSVRNEYLLHRQIHEWFAAGQATAEIKALNERVYAELFLTPSSDPWLGLIPPDTYTALDRGGVK